MLCQNHSRVAQVTPEAMGIEGSRLSVSEGHSTTTTHVAAGSQATRRRTRVGRRTTASRRRPRFHQPGNGGRFIHGCMSMAAVGLARGSSGQLSTCLGRGRRRFRVQLLPHLRPHAALDFIEPLLRLMDSLK